jgi:hypothetical protein
MNWYVAKIVFRIVSGDGNHNAQFDEQLRLISAGDESEAFEKAYNIGCRNQDNFTNNRNEPVKWEFIDVAELNAWTNCPTVRSSITKYTKHPTRNCTWPGRIINHH